MSESWKEKIWDFFLLNAGTVLVAVGVYFFKFPNHFSMGGVSGLSILLGQAVHVDWLTPGMFNSVFNLLFLILGFLMLDKGFGFRTVYCTVLYSGLVQILEWICPLKGPLTNERMLELFFAVILPSVGAAILFNINASTGGTEIVALILKKYSGMDVGRALLVVDVAIAAGALVVFDISAGLYSLLGLVFKSVLVDSAIESFNRRKAFFVITSRPELVTEFVTHKLVRGATVWKAEGAYTHEVHHVVLTVLSRGQAVVLRHYLKKNDPQAFLIVANSSEIFGKGFLRA